MKLGLDKLSKSDGMVALAETKDVFDLVRIADGVNYYCSRETEFGFENGYEFGQLIGDLKSRKKVWAVFVDDYATYYFIGSYKSVMAKIKALPDDEDK